MKAIIYFVFLNEVFNNFGLAIVSSYTNSKKTILMKFKANEVFLQRSKRYLVFEKGATLTIQGNIAKSIIPPAPRGLNMITEYTLVYDLPSDLNFFRRQHKNDLKNAITPTITATASHSLNSLKPLHQHQQIVPFNYDYLHQMHPEYFYKNAIKTKYFPSKKNAADKCFRDNFFAFNEKNSNTRMCLKRIKRNRSWSVSELTTSQRMFYDLIEKWSLLHGFLPRYCFMRTLCESFELLLPYGYSLLHDIIHIFLGYTKPWAFHHKIFGHSLRQRHSIDECAKLYGAYCRASWLDFITSVVHGSRAADFVRFLAACILAITCTSEHK